MSNLAIAALVSGAIVLAWACLVVFARTRFTAALAAFPRSVPAGRLLAAVAVAWFTAVLFKAGINWIDVHRPLVLCLALVGYLAVIFLADEMLAVRAFGSLLFLAAQPIINAAFMHASPWRLVMTTFAYIIVIKGCVLVWSPYLFRRGIAFVMDDSRRGAAAGIVTGIAGLAMILLAFLVY